MHLKRKYFFNKWLSISHREETIYPSHQNFANKSCLKPQLEKAPGKSFLLLPLIFCFPFFPPYLVFVKSVIV